MNLSTTVVQPDGTFQTTFNVPDLPVDHYMVDAIDESQKVGLCMFTVVSFIGGGDIPVNDFVLLTLYIGLASIASVTAVATVIYVKRRKDKK